MQPVRKFQPPDNHHVEAAQGWLELGNHLEANEELERIAPQLKAHPSVLELRWKIYAQAKKWDACFEIGQSLVNLLPDHDFGYIHRSFALNELKRTEEAFDLLEPAYIQFPRSWTIPYNLACYCAQLNQIEECEQWFKRAMAIDEKAVRKKAIDDPDMQPLWKSLSGTVWKKI